MAIIFMRGVVPTSCLCHGGLTWSSFVSMVCPCDGMILGGPGGENDMSSVGHGQIPQQDPWHYPNSAGGFVSV